MKQLLISLGAVVLIMVLWGFFFSFSHTHLDKCKGDLKEEVLPLIKEERFDEASVKLEEISKDLKTYINRAKMFAHSEELFEIESTLTRAEEFIKADDVSNGSGEVAALIQQLDYMLDSELPNINNIL